MTLKNAPPREIKRREMVVTSKLQWHVQHSNPNLLYSTTLSSHRHPTFIKKGASRSNQETCRNTPDGISPEWTYSHNRNNPTVENSTGNAYSSQRTAMIKERNRRPKPFLKTRYRLLQRPSQDRTPPARRKRKRFLHVITFYSLFCLNETSTQLTVQHATTTFKSTHSSIFFTSKKQCGHHFTEYVPCTGTLVAVPIIFSSKSPPMIDNRI